MILDPSASDSFQEDPFLEDPFLEVPFLEVPFLEDPCLVDPFLVALVPHLLEDPFQGLVPCHAEGPLDPFLADHFAAMKSWDQMEVCQMVGHYVVQDQVPVVQVSFLAVVAHACLVVDHALESSALLDLQDHLAQAQAQAQVQVLVHGTLEEVLC